MSTSISAAQHHVDEGNRFLESDRPADAAAEFTMAIRASAPAPNPDALTGRAFALLESDATTKDTLAAFAEARPYGNENPRFMTQYVRLYLVVYESYAKSRDIMDKAIKKRAMQLQKDAYAGIDSIVTSFKAASDRNDAQALVWATRMVSLADWMDEYEIENEWLGGRRVNPCRDLAPQLYRPVSESGIERLLNDPDMKAEFRRDVTGRAERQLVYRGNDAVPKKGRKSAGGTGTSGIRSLSWKVLAVLLVVSIVLLMVKWWLGGLVLLAAAGYVLYQLKMKAA